MKGLSRQRLRKMLLVLNWYFLWLLLSCFVFKKLRGVSHEQMRSFYRDFWQKKEVIK